MKSYIKILTFAATVAAFSGAQSLYACATCGCSGGTAQTKEKTATGTNCPSGVCSLSSAPKAEVKTSDGDNISTLQMKTHVDSGDAILLDARAGKYDDGYRIPGAKSLNSSSTAEEIAAVIPSKNAAVVTYCGSLKCPASKALAEHLKKLGYTHVHEYPEGIAGWRAAGGQVNKVK